MLIRCLLAGLLWAVGMGVILNDGPRTVSQALIHLGMGVFFGLLLWVVISFQQRRFYGGLDSAGREAAVHAVETGRPSADPRIHEASQRLADRWAHKRWRPWQQVVFFGLFMALSVYVVRTGTPWGWAGLVIFPLACWYSIRTEERQRVVAARFLEAGGVPR